MHHSVRPPFPAADVRMELHDSQAACLHGPVTPPTLICLVMYPYLHGSCWHVQQYMQQCSCGLRNSVSTQM